MKKPKFKDAGGGRGLIIAEFADCNGEACSIQTSSRADGAYIWLGQRQGTHHMGKCMARMHLDQKHAAWLWPVLKQFSETGVLGNVKTTKRGRKS